MTIKTRKRSKGSMLLLQVIVALVVILSSAVFSSCNSNQTTTKIHAVKMLLSASVNWDEDSEPDGVQFLLIPTDIDGWPVRDDMIVGASLWSQPSVFKREKGELIQEWKDLRITKLTYERYGEARIRLEYSGYVPQPSEYGILEVKVQTTDGRFFSFEEALRLGHSWTEINTQSPSGCCF